MICINTICISTFQIILMFIITSILIYLYQKFNDKINNSYKFLSNKLEENEKKILTNTQLYNYNNTPQYNPDTFTDTTISNTLPPPIDTSYVPTTTQVGILYKYTIADTTLQPGDNDDSVVLPLYGRQTYRGSNKWIYYTKLNGAIIPIYYKNIQCNKDFGCSELYTDDIISVPALNGNFKVHINSNEKL